MLTRLLVDDSSRNGPREVDEARAGKRALVVEVVNQVPGVLIT